MLAEIAVAHSLGRHVHPIVAEWAGHAKDSRTFRFPDDLHSAISDWETYYNAREQKVHDARKDKLSLESRRFFEFWEVVVLAVLEWYDSWYAWFRSAFAAASTARPMRAERGERSASWHPKGHGYCDLEA